MRIAIINMTAGGISGGYKKYLLNIIPRMANNVNVESILCASPVSLKVQDWFEPYDKVKFVDCLPFRLFGYNDTTLYQELEKFTPDVLFIPLERYLSFMDVPVVNMVQNMLPMVSIPNNTLKERLRNFVQKGIAGRAVKRSKRVIAVSNFVKEYISSEWSISPKQIGLVYHGIDFDAVVTEGLATIPREWDNKFLFTAGSIDPYRGLEDIFLAMKLLSEQSIDIRLVIAGDVRPAMHSYRERLNNMIQKLNISSNVYWAGKLHEKEMSWCYKNCQAFIMSSRVEACPNIVLEAMSHGCISVSANNPPLPEFYGDTAIYYTSNDENSLTEAIRHMLSIGEGQRRSISEKARKRASKFSWDITAERTITELKEAIYDAALN